MPKASEQPTYICSESQPHLSARGYTPVWYVAQLQGDGGADWGWTDKRAKALPLTAAQARAFANDRLACGKWPADSSISAPKGIGVYRIDLAI